MKARFFIVLLCFARYLRYGLSSNTVERVINGTNTDITLRPYMVSLEVNGQHICGGAIINNWWVLTAAHCFFDVYDVEYLLKQLTLRSSCSNRNDESCVSYNVSKYYIQEKYSVYKMPPDYDIAVVQVSPPFTYNDRTKAVDLPPDGDVREEWGTACGWGYYSKTKWGRVNEIPSKYLKCATVPRVDNCGLWKKEILTPRMKCYGYEEGGTNICVGDSGGPLVNIDNIILGITSWGHTDCDTAGFPGVYADVKLPELKQWIKEKTGMD